MNPYLVEFTDGVQWVGMGSDSQDAASLACSFHTWKFGDKPKPNFTVYTIEVADADESD